MIDVRTCSPTTGWVPATNSEVFSEWVRFHQELSFV